MWVRHLTVYSRNIISNAISPFIDPLLFIVGIGIGLGSYIGVVEYAGLENLSYLTFLTIGITISSSMFTATFETTYGTYFRMEYEFVYDGILGAPMSVYNILIGEALWAATKGLIFCLAVAVVGLVFSISPPILLLIAPVLGFIGGLMFAAMGFFVTSYVKAINHFSILFTAVLSPMFFFSGVIFPLERLPAGLRPVAEILPLTHPVRIGRSLALGVDNPLLIWDITYIVLFVTIIGGSALIRLRNRLID